MTNQIYKYPTVQDIELIEGIITKYQLENVEIASKKHQDIINLAQTPLGRWGAKLAYCKDFFPYSQKLWNIIFLVINQKVTPENLPYIIEENTKLPLDLCKEISQIILEDENIQYEISAITLRSESDDEYQEYQEEEPEDNPIIQENPSTEEPPQKKGGLGQDLF